MILLKANSNLRVVFSKLIKTMGERIEWDGIFEVKNNSITLFGKVRSLIFDFDYRDIRVDVLDNTEVKEYYQLLDSNNLNSTINMILYVFGKWGKIKGLKVEKDYEELNQLLKRIFYQVNVESNLSDDKIAFYKSEIRITYEDAVQLIMDQNPSSVKYINESSQLSDVDAESEAESESESDTDSGMEANKKAQEAVVNDENEKIRQPESVPQELEQQEYIIGLWHRMIWTDTNYEIKTLDTFKSGSKTLRNHFFNASYQCPICDKQIYMCVFPPGHEYRIETQMDAVYLARTYACAGCNSFFTPKPYKNFSEGDLFTLCFESDQIAFEEYIDLLGSKSTIKRNSNFNMYENDYLHKDEQTKEQDWNDIKNEFDNNMKIMQSLPVEKINQSIDLLEGGFFEESDVKKFKQKLIKERRRAKKAKKNNNISNRNTVVKNSNKEIEPTNNILQVSKTLQGSQINSQQSDKQKELNNTIVVHKVENQVEKQVANNVVNKVENKIENKVENNQSGIINDDQVKQENLQQWKTKIIGTKSKSYKEIDQLIEEAKLDQNLSEEHKTKIIQQFERIKQTRGELELSNILKRYPLKPSKKDYQDVVSKMEAFSPEISKKFLQEAKARRDGFILDSINDKVKSHPIKERRELWQLFDQIEKEWGEEEASIKVLDSLRDKLIKIDTKRQQDILKKEVAQMSYEEGVQAYESIQNELILPELKVDTLLQLEKRLQSIKSQECELLVKKLSDAVKWLIQDESRFHFFDVRKWLRNEVQHEAQHPSITNLLQVVARDRGYYEYPIFLGDASIRENGRRGFVLTPDVLYYKSLWDEKALDVENIVCIEGYKKLLKRGIYALLSNGSVVRISSRLGCENIEELCAQLNSFVEYLKEKPISREIRYLAKETHSVKCCTRCGYVYENEKICPNCGNTINK